VLLPFFLLFAPVQPQTTWQRGPWD
jgi:hypothetical protein